MLEISLLSRIEHPASATSEIIAFSFSAVVAIGYYGEVGS